eukprot:CAMPEP_0114167650 /NCGR_PEP_ID=MMETSP0043_2-20121206/32540_1 /TAXON_ID=464988 /ORGANISM="Hemiselmis andersenii, Strain CCMP644" /LENGTH=203 /DNA_ID=CAMNT_0001264843 /DNA_START=134 /DNA_END=745 /DNA_ORIENTATION=-
MAFPQSPNDETSFGRRGALAALGLGLATAASPAVAEVVGPPPSGLSQAQGGIQALINPGHWIGQFIGINSHGESWDFDASPEEVSAAFVKALKNITPEQRKALVFTNLDIAEASAEKLKVLTWTKLEWLDVLDVAFKPLAEGGCTATVNIYATGFFPTSIPGAPILNTLLFFFPFASPSPSGGMLQNNRCNILYKMVKSNLKA